MSGFLLLYRVALDVEFRYLLQGVEHLNKDPTLFLYIRGNYLKPRSQCIWINTTIDGLLINRLGRTIGYLKCLTPVIKIAHYSYIRMTRILVRHDNIILRLSN